MSKIVGHVVNMPVISDPNCPPNKIYFLGKGFDFDDIDDSTAVVSFRHIFRSTYMGDSGRHACLINGYWCWRNVLRHPQDVISYFKRKARNG